MKKPNTDHVVLVPPSTVLCRHCGESYAIAMPCSVSILAAAGGAFTKDHARCRAGANGVACTFCCRFGHYEDKCPRTEYHGRIEHWLRGPDTGQSSLALCQVLTGKGHGQDHYPFDPDDFGRCHRFLVAFPDLRPRILEMAAVSRPWAALAGAWDELEALYREELPQRRAPKLYARMVQLRAPFEHHFNAERT